MAETDDEVLTRRAVSLAVETASEEVSDSIALLLFRIGEEWYAVRASYVREIFQDYAVTSVPCVPEFILGVTNVRGEILSVTDPAKLMSIGTIQGIEGIQPPAVVITHEGVATAVVVDEIGDITEVPSGAIEPPVSIIDRSQAEFIAGSVHIEDQMIGLINVERVLEPIGGKSS